MLLIICSLYLSLFNKEKVKMFWVKSNPLDPELIYLKRQFHNTSFHIMYYIILTQYLNIQTNHVNVFAFSRVSFQYIKMKVIS